MMMMIMMMKVTHFFFGIEHCSILCDFVATMLNADWLLLVNVYTAGSFGVNILFYLHN